MKLTSISDFCFLLLTAIAFKDICSFVKYLLYSEPIIELSKPFYKNAHADFFFLPLISTLIDGGVESRDIMLICGEPQRNSYEEFCNQNNIRLTIIPATFYKQFYSKQSLWYKNLYSEPKVDHSYEKITSFFAGTLQDFKPDVIFPFAAPVPFFNTLFPEAIIFQSEAGFSSRAPFPLSIFLDPFGGQKNNFIAKSISDFKKLGNSTYKSQWIESIRSLYIDKIIDAKNPFIDLNIKKNYPFDKYILLPLQFSGHYLFDLHCNFDTQLDFIFYVLDNISEDVGVIVTEHANRIYGDVITEEIGDFLRSKYKNFIFYKEFRDYEPCSQYLLSQVDGVISVQSSVALQALLWKKPIFIIGDSYLKTFSRRSLH